MEVTCHVCSCVASNFSVCIWQIYCIVAFVFDNLRQFSLPVRHSLRWRPLFFNKLITCQIENVSLLHRICSMFVYLFMPYSPYVSCRTGHVTSEMLLITTWYSETAAYSATCKCFYFEWAALHPQLKQSKHNCVWLHTLGYSIYYCIIALHNFYILVTSQSSIAMWPLTRGRPVQCVLRHFGETVRSTLLCNASAGYHVTWILGTNYVPWLLLNVHNYVAQYYWNAG